MQIKISCKPLPKVHAAVIAREKWYILKDMSAATDCALTTKIAPAVLYISIEIS